LLNISGGDGVEGGEGPYDVLPAWSPDGSRIAFISIVMDTSIHIGSPYVSRIYVMDADGRNRFQVAGDGATGVSWSLSGDELVFSTDQGGIGVMGLEGKNVRWVIPNQPGVLGAALFRPSYSPDGTKIVFMKFVQFEDLDNPGSTMGYFQVVVVGVDGTDVTRLSGDRVEDMKPTWSTDGTKIAFTSYRGGYWGIYVMDEDGNNVVKLVDGGGAGSYPVWSPDGKRIAFTFTYDRDVDTEIYVMNSDGSDVVRLTDNSNEERSLSWSPDGTRLAVSGRDLSGDRLDSSGDDSIYLLNMV
jgi:TolB protein